jgi:SNF family Na+-dependent transporter
VRLPAFSHGVTSFLWALGLAVFIWLGGMSVGISRATAGVVAALSGCAIFLFVRVFGDEELRQPSSRDEGP